MTKKLLTATLSLILLALAGAGLSGQLAPLSPVTTANAATPNAAAPPVQGCSGVTVTSITNENVGLTLGEKVTVNWTLTQPSGACASLEGFKVSIQVTRRTGRTANRTVDLPASARSTDVNFTEAGDKIKSITATVTAKFSGAATGTKTENSDN